MSEIPSDASQELARSPARAKITVPLRDDDQPVATLPAPRITRPLVSEEADIQTVTLALSSSLPAQPAMPAEQDSASLVQQGGSSSQPRAQPSPLHSAISPRKLKRIYRLQYFSRKHLRRARISDHRSRRRLWATIWTTTTSLSLLFLLIIGVASYIAYNFIRATQSTYAGQVLTLRDLLPPDNLKIYDAQGNLIDQMTDQGIHT